MLLILIKPDADVGTVFLEQRKEFFLHFGRDEDGATLGTAIGGFAEIRSAMPEMIRVARWHGIKHAFKTTSHAEYLLDKTKLAALLRWRQDVGIEITESFLRLRLL